MADAPDNLDDIRRHLKRAIDTIAARTDGYEEAREYYDGSRAEVADSRAALAIIRQSKTTPLSFAHIPVDVIVEKVELASITAPGSAKRILDEWMDKNDIDDESIDWILKASYFGDYYVVTDPTGLEDDDSIAVDSIESVGMSPLSTVRIYDRKTGRTPEYGAHFWDTESNGQKYTRAILWYDDSSVKVIAPGAKITDANLFVYDAPADGEDEDAYIEHPGGHMLLHHLPIGGKPYGVPLHRKAYGPQDAITKISANNLVNVDSLGLPNRWALLDPNAEIDDDIDDDFGDDTAGSTGDRAATLRDQTTGRRVRSLPGTIEFLRGVKDTGTYEGSQSDPFLSNLDFYIRAMGVACGIALFELDPSGEVPSGEARRRAEARANRTARRVQRQAGAFLREIADTVLALVGVTAEVAVTFTPTETATDKDGLELVSLKVKAGVPLRQALLEAGYTDEQVGKWYPSTGAAFSPDLVTVTAAALASLGNAKTLGAITDEGIEAMIPELFRYASITLAEEGLPGVVTNPAAIAAAAGEGE